MLYYVYYVVFTYVLLAVQFIAISNSLSKVSKTKKCDNFVIYLLKFLNNDFIC